MADLQSAPLNSVPPLSFDRLTAENSWRTIQIGIRMSPHLRPNRKNPRTNSKAVSKSILAWFPSCLPNARTTDKNATIPHTQVQAYTRNHPSLSVFFFFRETRRTQRQFVASIFFWAIAFARNHDEWRTFSPGPALFLAPFLRGKCWKHMKATIHFFVLVWEGAKRGRCIMHG